MCGSHDGESATRQTSRRDELPRDRPAAVLLQPRVDRGVDPQAAAPEHVDAVVLDQLVLHVVEHVRLPAPRVDVAPLQAERLLHRGGALVLAYEVALDHRLQDLVAALHGQSGLAQRVELGGRLGKAGEERRLVEGQVLRVAREEDPRRRFDAHGGLPVDRAVGHVVQVLLEDPLLGVQLLQVVGHLGLADLPREVALGVLDVEVADELLGDRGSTLERLAGGHVLDRRACDAGQVDPAVLVEAAVLDGDRRLPEHRRHVHPRDRGPDGVRLHVPEPGAVGGVDDRRGPLVDRLQPRDVRRRVGDRDHVAHGGQRRDHHACDQAEDHDEDHAATPVVGVPALLSLAVAHRPAGAAPGIPQPRRSAPLGAGA